MLELKIFPFSNQINTSFDIIAGRQIFGSNILRWRGKFMAWICYLPFVIHRRKFTTETTTTFGAEWQPFAAIPWPLRGRKLPISSSFPESISSIQPATKSLHYALRDVLFFLFSIDLKINISYTEQREIVKVKVNDSTAVTPVRSLTVV